MVSATERRELLEAREAVWRAWFGNDTEALQRLVPADTVAINAGEEAWGDMDAVLKSARDFAGSGVRLVRLEFPRTVIQRFGDVAILYSTYMFELDASGGRTATSGRATEVFVRRDGRWVNPGWHTDSGR